MIFLRFPFIQFFILYVFVPLLLRKATKYHIYIILIAVFFLILILIILYHYSKSKKHFMLDAFCMIAGLIFLYLVEYYFYKDTNTFNLVVYGISAISYVPFLVHIKQHYTA